MHIKIDRSELLVRLYKALLYAYPAEFRRAYRSELLLAFRDSLRDSNGRVVATALHLAGDLVVSVGRERLEAGTRAMRGPGAVAVLCAALLGIGIAYVDSRPHWDDTGITAGALLLTAMLFGIALPNRPWTLALAVGVWIPLYMLLRNGQVSILFVLLFPLAGARGGSAIRRAAHAFGPVDEHDAH